MPARDLSRPFTLLVVVSWAVAVAIPLLISLVLGQSFTGAPLVGIVLWFGVVRFGRWLSPASRADALARRGRNAEALAICDRALAVEGNGAWTGARRLVWLNRRTTALLALGRIDEAAFNALDTLDVSADPETLGNLSLALLRMNRYDEAEATARLTLSLTRERSVLAHATLAHVLLARGRPAEAEAMAGAGAEDARALAPLVRQEHYVLCLSALCRGMRTIKPGSTPPRARVVKRASAELRSAARSSPTLRVVAQAEEADRLSIAPETQARALTLIDAAVRDSLDYALWLIAQPGSFMGLTQDAHFALYAAQAAERMTMMQASGPSAETVMEALAAAAEDAQPQPAPQSSMLAIVAQIATLGGTFILLLIWTLRFVLFS